jgi:hypothetical protein
MLDVGMKEGSVEMLDHEVLGGEYLHARRNAVIVTQTGEESLHPN